MASRRQVARSKSTADAIARTSERHTCHGLFAVHRQPVPYGETTSVNGVEVKLVPAGHVLGSAQAVIGWKGLTMVASGDYKRRRDPTCAGFEPTPCHVFISEATFGLPVFTHPPDAEEVGRLVQSLGQFPDRAHLVGAYALGKAQRVIRLLREAGWDRPIYVHGALERLNALYERMLPAARAHLPALPLVLSFIPPTAEVTEFMHKVIDAQPAAATSTAAFCRSHAAFGRLTDRL